MDIDSLVAASRRAMEDAYAPYSQFKVGAAVLGATGRVYTGCNVENASYGLSICAERAAIFRAVSEGELAIRAVAISNSTGKAAPPCGACRQVIAEFAPSDDTVSVYVASEDGLESYTLDELLPRAFEL